MVATESSTYWKPSLGYDSPATSSTRLWPWSTRISTSWRISSCVRARRLSSLLRTRKAQYRQSLLAEVGDVERREEHEALAVDVLLDVARRGEQLAEQLGVADRGERGHLVEVEAVELARPWRGSRGRGRRRRGAPPISAVMMAPSSMKVAGAVSVLRAHGSLTRFKLVGDVGRAERLRDLEGELGPLALLGRRPECGRGGAGRSARNCTGPGRCRAVGRSAGVSRRENLRNSWSRCAAREARALVPDARSRSRSPRRAATVEAQTRLAAARRRSDGVAQQVHEDDVSSVGSQSAVSGAGRRAARSRGSCRPPRSAARTSSSAGSTTSLDDGHARTQRELQLAALDARQVEVLAHQVEQVLALA